MNREELEVKQMEVSIRRDEEDLKYYGKSNGQEIIRRDLEVLVSIMKIGISAQDDVLVEVQKLAVEKMKELIPKLEA